MIFVTVGTHEQPFDRLVKKIDYLAQKRVVEDKIFIQRGYSTSVPKFCESEILLPFDLMQRYFKESRIVITHGGPCSIIQSMLGGKIPIVIPRSIGFSEHVDDHQIEFTKFLEEKQKVVAVYNINRVEFAILNYDVLVKNLITTDNIAKHLKIKKSQFCSKLEAYL
jgi:UDP-N-acetylglucosamine transferase subunit ALG13